MIFAIVGQWRKNLFSGLSQVAFSQSTLLMIAQAIVRIVRDWTEKINAEPLSGIDGLFVCWDKIFGSDQWFLALMNNGEKRVSGIAAGRFELMRLFSSCLAIDRD